MTCHCSYIQTMGSFSVFDIVLLSVNGRKQSTSDFAMSIIVAVGLFFKFIFLFLLKMVNFYCFIVSFNKY